MQKAISAAINSAEAGDYPLGAVIVKDDKIITTGYQTVKREFDPVNGHAEIDAIRKACRKLKQHYLKECTLYSTHEPCPMCTSASIWAKIDTIVYGASREDMIKHMRKKIDENFSWRQIDISCKTVIDQGSPQPKLIPHVLREKCLKLFEYTK